MRSDYPPSKYKPAKRLVLILLWTGYALWPLVIRYLKSSLLFSLNPTLDWICALTSGVFHDLVSTQVVLILLWTGYALWPLRQDANNFLTEVLILLWTGYALWLLLCIVLLTLWLVLILLWTGYALWHLMGSFYSICGRKVLILLWTGYALWP